MSEELHPIADTKHRHTAGQHEGRKLWSIIVEDAGRATGEDETLHVKVGKLLFRHARGEYLAVYVGLTQSSRDQSTELRTEVQYDNGLVGASRGLAGVCRLPKFLFGDLKVRRDLNVACSRDPSTAR
jgi:hypothetical protein